VNVPSVPASLGRARAANQLEVALRIAPVLVRGQLGQPHGQHPLQLGVGGEVLQALGAARRTGAQAGLALDPLGIDQPESAQRKACRLRSTAVPFRSMADSIDAAVTGSTPAW
jgi:hypothetical protein